MKGRVPIRIRYRETVELRTVRGTISRTWSRSRGGEARRRLGSAGCARYRAGLSKNFPQPMRHRNMRSKVVPRSHGLSSLQTVKARVLNLLRAKREQSRRERRRMKDRHLAETEFPMSAGHSDGSRRSLRRDCRAHVHEQAERNEACECPLWKYLKSNPAVSGGG